MQYGLGDIRVLNFCPDTALFYFCSFSIIHFLKTQPKSHFPKCFHRSLLVLFHSEFHEPLALCILAFWVHALFSSHQVLQDSNEHTYTTRMVFFKLLVIMPIVSNDTDLVDQANICLIKLNKIGNTREKYINYFMALFIFLRYNWHIILY